MRPWMTVSAGVLALGMAGAAAGQAWIGQVVGQMASAQKEHECMVGTPQSPKEVQEALTPATAALRSYRDGVLGRQPALVTAAFHPGDGKARWRSGAVERRPADAGSIANPLATAGSAIDPAPIWFTRAGDSGTAMGAWRVHDRAGRTTGWYRGMFRRSGFVWKAREIEAVSGAAGPPAVEQYCRKPGDAVAYRARIEADEARRAAKKAAKAAARGGSGQARP